MIKRVSANKESFRTVEFSGGLNVVLADRSESSSSTDSRNGVGKTTLIEIIDFCFGSDKPKKGVLSTDDLNDWEFTVEFVLDGQDISVTRSLGEPKKIRVSADFSSWSIKPEEENGIFTFSAKEWKQILGEKMFNLTSEQTEKKYSPTFRSQISYHIRKSDGAYLNPFEQYEKQRTWDKQVNNCFLLDLNWQIASEFQLLKDEEDMNKKLLSAAKSGALGEVISTTGEMKTAATQVKTKIETLKEHLKDFKVHPQYYDIQKEANDITRAIKEIANQIQIDEQLLDNYYNSLKEEDDIPGDRVRSVYEEAGLTFTQDLKRQFEAVQKFHIEILHNRRQYLDDEIKTLKHTVKDKKKRVTILSTKRAEKIQVLKTHNALDEYSQMQTRLNNLEQELQIINERIALWKRIEEGKSTIKIKKEQLLQAARKDLEERHSVIEEAVKIFSEITNEMYGQEGKLVINVKETGYDFSIDIERDSSQGVNSIKVFTYDLTHLGMGLKSNMRKSPKLLIHDSIIFDGVDERQIAKALQIVEKASRENGFQYICTMNSDVIPWNDLPEEFKTVFKNAIRITLRDDNPSQSLLGFRQ